LVKDGWKSFRTTELDRKLLKALKRAHVGVSDGDRLRMAIVCLAEKHNVMVGARA